MIYTLTFNPSLDLTVEVDEIKSGKIVRGEYLSRDAGGKGLNVSRALSALGERSVVLGFSGGANGMVLEQLLAEARLTAEMVACDGETRANISIVVRKGGKHYKINSAGPPASRAAQKKLLALVKRAVKPGDYLIISGATLQGMSAGYVKESIRAAKKKKACVFLDADGKVLRRGLEAGPFLIKPNREEIARLMGWKTYDQRRAARELRSLLRNGLRHIVVSLGADGAFYCGLYRMFRVIPPRVKVSSLVGCGDALLAGLAWALKQGCGMEDALRWGVAAGTAKVIRQATQMPSKQEVQKLYRRVKVETIEGPLQQ